MENKQRYLDTIEELMVLADEIAKNQAFDVVPMSKDDIDKAEFVAGAKQLIIGLFGEKSPMYQEIGHAMNIFHYNRAERYLGIKGVLLAAKKRIEQGWLSNTRNELFSEIFADYLEHGTFSQREKAPYRGGSSCRCHS